MPMAQSFLTPQARGERLNTHCAMHCIQCPAWDDYTCKGAGPVLGLEIQGLRIPMLEELHFSMPSAGAQG